VLRTKKGFTLIELLVVIVIIGILVAIALPNFIKIKIKAREAEVKQNLHAIQLAVERYAVDNEGRYPFFLYGGDTYFNVGTSKYALIDWIQMGATGKHPFDMFNANLGTDDPHTYPGVGLSRANMGEQGNEFGDALESDGYMTTYPNNPFLSKKASNIHGEDSTNWAPYIPWQACGGRSGRSMFNIGWAGEAPTLMNYDDPIYPETKVLFESPGQFYYHPRFGDGAANADHFTAQYNTVGGFGAGNFVTSSGASARPGMVWSHDVVGYDLLGYGDVATAGMDIDYSLLAGSYYHNGARTGYLNNTPEPNPYNSGNNYAPRTQPDGIPDYYIIHLSSSQDAKPQGVG
jgi:prepilin-type N-terminal cleavage/methylation domain-containing protein